VPIALVLLVVVPLAQAQVFPFQGNALAGSTTGAGGSAGWSDGVL
jgi:hypothetical protein